MTRAFKGFQLFRFEVIGELVTDTPEQRLIAADSFQLFRFEVIGELLS